MIASIPVLLIVVATVLCVWFYRGNRGTSSIPGPVAIPIFGSVYHLLINYHRIIPAGFEFCQLYGGIWKAQLFHKLLIVISTPEHLQTFFANTKNSLDKPAHYQGSVELTGAKNIFVSNGEDWKQARKIFVTTMNQNPSHQADAFTFATKKLIAEFREKANGETFQCFSHFRKMALYISWGNIFGELGRAEKIGEEVVDKLDLIEFSGILRALFYPLLNTFLFKLLPQSRTYFKSVDFIRNHMKTTLLEKIEDYKDLKKNNKALPNCFFYNYMENYPVDNLDQIVEEYIMLLQTSVVTTPGALSYLLTILALNPEAQEKILEEYESIKGILGREPENNDLHMYEYLDRVIKESLRILPMFGVFARVLPRDVKFGEHTVPKGAIIAPFNPAVCHNPDLYPEPLKFDPDRFLPENVAKRHPYAFMPFMLGPRACPGKNYAMSIMKLVTPMILKEFKVITHYQNIQEVLDNARFQIAIIDKQSFPIKLVPRN